MIVRTKPVITNAESVVIRANQRRALLCVDLGVLTKGFKKFTTKIFEGARFSVAGHFC